MARLTRIEAKQDAHTRQLDAILAAVSAQGVPLPTLRSILEGFGEQLDQLDPGAVEAKLRAKTEEYRELSARLQRLTNADPRVQALREQAKTLIDHGAFAAVDARLADAETLDLESARELQDQLQRPLGSAAESRAERAAVAGMRFDYRAAAEHYAEAARIIAPLGDSAAWRYRLQEASALYDHGRERGDNDPLRTAIDRYRDLLARTPRAERRDDWAKIQNNLGNALATLGQRESGTARLEEAVAAYRAALEERTRERVPLDWAYSQHALAHALEALADRRGDPDILREAVACMRRAAEVYRAGGVSYWLPVAEESIARMEGVLAQLTAASTGSGGAQA